MKHNRIDKSDSLADLKEFMDFSVDIHHWNEKRETAKKFFTFEAIAQLDASGFVKEGIKPANWEELNAVI